LRGGEVAGKEPHHAATGLLYEMFGGDLFDRTDWQQLTAFSETERAALKTMLSRGLNSPWCGSAGRLFDAVASLAGLRQKMRFEGQAAMELEFALEGAETDAAYEFAAGADSRPTVSPIMPHAPVILDWSPMIQAILGDVQRGAGIGEIAARFHNALAEGVVQVAHLFSESLPHGAHHRAVA
jgi:hydrogenase maturation protein HypF